MSPYATDLYLRLKVRVRSEAQSGITGGGLGGEGRRRQFFFHVRGRATWRGLGGGVERELEREREREWEREQMIKNTERLA
jgi:hypothetical protein